jgi:LuxR family maltose regulon positive regulatory protein
MYLIASLQKFADTIGETAWPLLQSPQPPAIKTILTILLNDLGLLTAADRHTNSFYVLVLEDYHVITAASIHEALTYFIDHLPPQIHVIITTRADPPLPFPRWRARDQLSEIRAADLRFTSDEVATFLNDRMGLHLSVADVMALETRTEGWIAGLQLVALSLQGHTNKASFLQTFSGSHRYILNYLVDEVLNQQTKAVQEFLLRTSILDRLCGALCDALMNGGEHGNPADQQNPPRKPSPLTHRPNSQVILEQLYHANLFTIPLDDEGRWYRYHPLFAEALQHRLHQTHPESWRYLHSQASRWYEQEGLLADAIQHALRATDFSRMAELIEQSWPATWNQGAVATLLNWVHLLPPQILFARPSLAISHAWALALTGQIEAAEVDLRQVEVLIQQVGSELEPASLTGETLLGRIAALRAMLAARQGAPTLAVQLAQSALALIPTDAALLRGNACYALGLAYQQSGSLTEALAAYQAATRLGMVADDHFLTVTARYHQGRIWMAQGQLKMAATTYQQILSEAAQGERPLPVIGLAYVGYAEILYQWNMLTAATHAVESGLALSPTGSLTYTDGPLHRFVTLARIRQASQDHVGTRAAVQEAMDTASQTGIALDVEQATALQALIDLRLGQLENANGWVERYIHLLRTDDHFTYVHEFELLVFVRVLLAQGRAAEALALLADWLPLADATQRLGSLIEMWMLQALALEVAGQAVAAQQTLARALALAEPEGYIRLFVDEGEPMHFLLDDLRATLDDTNLQAYIDKLLATFENPPSRLPEAKIENPKSKTYKLIEPLTSRELEVLRLMAAGLSNAAMAEQLVVSVGTIKTHLKHIYGKLAVESRTQAVAQAHTLGLL